MLKKSLSLTTSDLRFPLSLQNVLGLIILIFIEKQRLNTFSPPPRSCNSVVATVLLLQCCCYSVVAYIIAVAVLYCVASFVLVGITF